MNKTNPEPDNKSNSLVVQIYPKFWQRDWKVVKDREQDLWECVSAVSGFTLSCFHSLFGEVQSQKQFWINIWIMEDGTEFLVNKLNESLMLYSTVYPRFVEGVSWKNFKAFQNGIEKVFFLMPYFIGIPQAILNLTVFTTVILIIQHPLLGMYFLTKLHMWRNHYFLCIMATNNHFPYQSWIMKRVQDVEPMYLIGLSYFSISLISKLFS